MRLLISVGRDKKIATQLFQLLETCGFAPNREILSRMCGYIDRGEKVGVYITANDTLPVRQGLEYCGMAYLLAHEPYASAPFLNLAAKAEEKEKPDSDNEW